MKIKLMFVMFAVLMCGLFANLTNSVAAESQNFEPLTAISVQKRMVCVRNGGGGDVRCERLPKRGETIDIVYGNNPKCVVTVTLLGALDQDNTVKVTIVKIAADNKEGKDLAPAPEGQDTVITFSADK